MGPHGNPAVAEMKQVAIDHEQAEILEELGERMMRDGDDRAFKVLSIALAYRYAPYVCHIDESAGMAEVHDIRERIGDYSRRVP